MGLTSLPKVGAGEVLGIVKDNDPARPVTRPQYQIDAAEWNAAMESIEAVCEALGLGDGSTSGSALEALVLAFSQISTLDASLSAVVEYMALYAMPSSGTYRRLSWSEHFLSSTGFAGGLATGASGGAVSSVIPSTAGRTGVLSISRGTTAGNRVGVSTEGKAITFGGGLWRFRADLRIPTLSNGTNRFTTYTGFGDILSADPVDGLFFRQADNVNGGKWQLVARSSNTETAVDTGISPTAGTWQKLEIEVAADGSSATGYIDGGSVGTVSSNIPTSGRDTGVIAANLIGSLGTTAVTIELDLCDWSFRPTVAL